MIPSFLRIALCCALLPFGGAFAAEPTASVELDVHRVKAADTQAALRAVAGADEVVVVDEDTVRVTGSPGDLAAARTVLELLELSVDTANAVAQRELGDATRIARVDLKRVPVSDAMSALRGKIRIARFAVHGDSTLLLRDTQEKVATALELLADMERKVD